MARRILYLALLVENLLKCAWLKKPHVFFFLIVQSMDHPVRSTVAVHGMVRQDNLFGSKQLLALGHWTIESSCSSSQRRCHFSLKSCFSPHHSPKSLRRKQLFIHLLQQFNSLFLVFPGLPIVYYEEGDGSIFKVYFLYKWTGLDIKLVSFSFVCILSSLNQSNVTW